MSLHARYCKLVQRLLAVTNVNIFLRRLKLLKNLFEMIALSYFTDFRKAKDC